MLEVIAAEEHRLHDPQFFLVRGQIRPSAEQPERARILEHAVRDLGLSVRVPNDWGLGPIASVHSPEYLDFLQHAWSQWQSLPGAGAEVIPNIHPQRRPASYPRSIVGRAGWHQADTACPMGPGTWRGVLAAAQVALEAAHSLASGTCQRSYALCRPPGHHAFSDMAGGFCFLNNTAIATEQLLKLFPRAAILDVDVHHGNGTQSIFYRRSDVFTVSVHADPHDFYPFFWGHAQERGEDAGEGFNFNIPLPLGTDDSPWLAAIDRALDRIALYAPDILVVALGLDAARSDPLQGMRISPEGFAALGERLRGWQKPLLLVQEGGYLGPELASNLKAFLSALRD